MFKVMTIVGTRPELIKMSRVIAEFDVHTKHILVHTGQNYDYELNQLFFDDLKIRKPDHFLDAVGENVAQTIGRIIEKADKVMQEEKPDAVMFYGDTNSCLAVISAKRQKIPVFHMEAGNRCFDERVPEELNRKILDHLSDINFVLTEHARRYLIAEGVRPETIIKSGSHMEEVLAYYEPQILKSKIVSDLHLKVGQYFVVSAHREENVDSRENMHDFLETLQSLAIEFDIPIIVSTHPRTQKKIDTMEFEPLHPNIKFLKPFGFCDYVKLQLDSKCVISDSGTIAEESSILNLPAITIRNAHERPEAVDVGTFIMSGLKKHLVTDAVKVVLAQHSKNERVIQPVPDYESGLVSKKILRAVLSYIPYVNRTVWYK